MLFRIQRHPAPRPHHEDQADIGESDLEAVDQEGGQAGQRPPEEARGALGRGRDRCRAFLGALRPSQGAGLHPCQSRLLAGPGSGLGGLLPQFLWPPEARLQPGIRHLQDEGGAQRLPGDLELQPAYAPRSEPERQLEVLQGIQADGDVLQSHARLPGCMGVEKGDWRDQLSLTAPTNLASCLPLRLEGRVGNQGAPELRPKQTIPKAGRHAGSYAQFKG